MENNSDASFLIDDFSMCTLFERILFFTSRMQILCLWTNNF